MTGSAKPGCYLLGIECDGATYHSARSARDRDKLRQRILENRGWNLHRIWSPDWWQDRDGEVQRLIEAIEAVRSEDIPMKTEPVEDDIEVDETTGQNPKLITRPYTLAVIPDMLRTENDLREYMIDVVRHEGPIQHELLFIRLRTAAGYGRAGRNIRKWLDDLIEGAVRNGQFKAIEDAYFMEETDFNMPRDWSDRPDTERKSDYLPKIEIATALHHIVKSAFGIAPDDAIREAFKLIGFRRTTEALDRGRSVIDTMIQTGELIHQEGSIRPA